MQNEIVAIIKSIGDQGGTGNVMKALEFSQADFQRGFDLANEMQNNDLVKLLYSNFDQNNIVVEFTLVGSAMYQKLTR